MMSGIKEKLEDIKWNIKKPLVIIKGYFENKEKYSTFDENTVFVYGAPEYGNLGDQAITLAQISFIQKIFPEKKVHVITENNFWKNILCLSSVTRKFGNLCISMGGGNMGDLYKLRESIRLTGVKMMKNAKIIVFPQSIDYEDNSPFLPKARKIYREHGDLAVFAREKNSEKKRRRYFGKCKGGLVPDIVLSYKPELPVSPRSGVIFCTRSDKEKNALSSSIIAKLRVSAEERFSLIKDIDTYGKEYEAPYEAQKDNLYKFWSELSKAELVVTDRLHGMIFSVITNTPCISLDNSTGKVGAVYEAWLKKANVCFVKSEEELDAALDFMKNCNSMEYDSKLLEQQFKPLAQYLGS